MEDLKKYDRKDWNERKKLLPPAMFAADSERETVTAGRTNTAGRPSLGSRT